MNKPRNVLRDTNQQGYPPDLGRMFLRASNVIPLAQNILDNHASVCDSTLTTFYSKGLYFHLDDNSPSDDQREAVYQTLAVWGASLVRFVSEVTVVDCAWIQAQGPEYDLRSYQTENIPDNCGVLVLTRPPKWDRDDAIALLVDKILWGRKNRPTFATIVSGSLAKYPHTTTTLTSTTKDIDESLRHYDPDTGLFRVASAKEARKRGKG